MPDFFIHNTSVVDDNVQIGEGTKIWHFSHLLPNTKIGKHCSFGQNCVIGPNVTIGKKGVLLTPHDVGSGRIYKYDIHVELITASLSGTHTGGFLKSIKNNVNVGQVDSFGAGQNIATFTY